MKSSTTGQLGCTRPLITNPLISNSFGTCGPSWPSFSGDALWCAINSPMITPAAAAPIAAPIAAPLSELCGVRPVLVSVGCPPLVGGCCDVGAVDREPVLGGCDRGAVGDWESVLGGGCDGGAGVDWEPVGGDCCDVGGAVDWESVLGDVSLCEPVACPPSGNCEKHKHRQQCRKKSPTGRFHGKMSKHDTLQ